MQRMIEWKRSPQSGYRGIQIQAVKRPSTNAEPLFYNYDNLMM